jgi:DNA recombination protein RmuC
MMDIFNLVFLLVGLIIGIPLGWLILKAKKSNGVPESEEVKIQLKLEVERSKKLSSELELLSEELRKERNEIIHLNGQNASLKTSYQNLQERVEEQKGELGLLQEKFALEFKNLGQFGEKYGIT